MEEIKREIMIVQTWAQSAWKKLELTPPCNLKMICEYLNIELHYCSIMGCPGIYHCNDNKHKQYIYIDPTQSWHLQRFYIAHEIGHAVIAKSKIAYDNNKEQFCNAFAKELLVPTPIILNDIKEYNHNHKNDKTAFLAYIYEVSYGLMQGRLSEILS